VLLAGVNRALLSPASNIDIYHSVAIVKIIMFEPLFGVEKSPISFDGALDGSFDGFLNGS